MAVWYWLVAGMLMAQPDSLPFKVLEGGQSGAEEARQVVARSAADMAALHLHPAGPEPRPKIDFTKTMVVGVFVGMRPTGGYTVEITRIEREPGGIVVSWREKKPDPSDMVTQAFTAPYQLVTLERVDGRVRFNAVK